MSEIRPEYLLRLKDALSDPDVRAAIRGFCAEQVRYYSSRVINEIRKAEPDNQKAAQDAGRLDAYEHLLPELQHFIENKLAGTHPAEDGPTV